MDTKLLGGGLLLPILLQGAFSNVQGMQCQINGLQITKQKGCGNDHGMTTSCHLII